LKLALIDDKGKIVDTYEDIEEYDLDDPASPFGLITWIKKTIKAARLKG
jgi:hypothetical protein